MGWLILEADFTDLAPPNLRQAVALIALRKAIAIAGTGDDGEDLGDAGDDRKGQSHLQATAPIASRQR